MDVPAELVSFAHRLADADGAVLRRYFRAGVASEAKPDESPVTVADREAETVVRELIGRHFPCHGVSGEEFGTDNGDAEWLWLIDPLDGTKTFLKGKPTFGGLIGLAFQGRLVLGVIDQPVLRERWIGADGHGTRHNGEVVRCRPCPGLEHAMMAAVGVDAETEADEPRVGPLRRSVRHMAFGLECYAYGLLASGHLDLAIDGVLGSDDIAALEPVVRNAGGVLTGLDGTAVDAHSTGRILAAGSPALHRLALARLGY
jgi:histidinol phosphatase-like enzyme (inositol monophosphatase family)